jgi:hypothetical protein
MKKNQSVLTDPTQKSILENAVMSSKDEQLDLYKSIFANNRPSCDALGGVDSEGKTSAYDKHDVFLRN